MPFQGKGWYHISGSKIPDEEFKTKQELRKLTKEQLLKYFLVCLKDIGLLWIGNKNKYERLKANDTLGIRFIELQEAIIERSRMSKKNLH